LSRIVSLSRGRQRRQALDLHFCADGAVFAVEDSSRQHSSAAACKVVAPLAEINETVALERTRPPRSQNLRLGNRGVSERVSGKLGIRRLLPASEPATPSGGEQNGRQASKGSGTQRINDGQRSIRQLVNPCKRYYYPLGPGLLAGNAFGSRPYIAFQSLDEKQIFVEFECNPE
jgi:hypothetical protein